MSDATSDPWPVFDSYLRQRHLALCLHRTGGMPEECRAFLTRRVPLVEAVMAAGRWMAERGFVKGYASVARRANEEDARARVAVRLPAEPMDGRGYLRLMFVAAGWGNRAEVDRLLEMIDAHEGETAGFQLTAQIHEGYAEELNELGYLHFAWKRQDTIRAITRKLRELGYTSQQIIDIRDKAKRLGPDPDSREGLLAALTPDALDTLRPADPFDGLLRAAESAKLKGKQKAIVMLLAEKGGRSPFADVGLVTEWGAEASVRYDKLYAALNRRLRPLGWTLRADDGYAIAEPFAGKLPDVGK